MKKLMLSFFPLLLLAAAATTATAQAKPKLAVFVVGMDDWKRGDVVAHIVGEELNRDKAYQVVTRSGAVQAKLKALRRASWYADGCDIRKWGQQHGVRYICLITTPNDQNFLARLYDTANSTQIRSSGNVLGEGMGAIQLKELSWELTGKLRSSALVADMPCMVFVKGGTFTIGFLEGRDDTDGGTAIDPFPARAGVAVGDFWIGKHEVTQGQWLSVIGSLSGEIRSNARGNNKPIMFVNLDDVWGYLTKLNARMVSMGLVNTGMIFALPTEAQWEYAARGGAKMYERCTAGCIYSGSNSLDEVSNHGGTLSDVMQKLPNELGIYDMSGNVWEWLADRYRTTYDGAPESGSQHTIRGGGHVGAEREHRVASRDKHASSTRHGNIGFRVV